MNKCEMCPDQSNCPTPDFQRAGGSWCNREMISKQAMNMYKALREIAKGLGRYNRDPLIHASNTIEDMRDLAKAALEPIEKGERNGD